MNIEGFDVLLDEEDIIKVEAYKWRLHKCSYKTSGHPYFTSTARIMNGHSAFLHRFLMGCSYKDGYLVDHCNGDTLDCRKQNLRKCTKSQNAMNSKINRTTNSTGYKGIFYVESVNKWGARIKFNQKTVYLGRFSSKEDAIRIYDIAALHYFKEFALLNLPKEIYKNINLEEELLKGNLQKTSVYRGVRRREGKWVAQITYDYKCTHIGNFDSEIEAAKAFDTKNIELRGGKARLNFPLDSISK